MGSQSPPKSETLSLIEACRWELDRLRGIASDYRAYNDTCREFIFAAELHLAEQPASNAGLATDLPAAAPAPHQRTLATSTRQACRDRAEEHRTFAERASDPQVKAILLEIAESYDKIATQEQ
jgi:hypothetical protein